MKGMDSYVKLDDDYKTLNYFFSVDSEVHSR